MRHVSDIEKLQTYKILKAEASKAGSCHFGKILAIMFLGEAI